MSTYQVTSITGAKRQRAIVIKSTDGPIVAFCSARDTLAKIRQCVEPCVQIAITAKTAPVREQRTKAMIQRLNAVAVKDGFTLDTADDQFTGAALLLLEPATQQKV